MIPAVALPPRKMRTSGKMREGYYFLEDEEGYVFQESDGEYYFYPCFKGEGFYYHSEESDYFHAGESLYDKEYGLQTLDVELQRLALDGVVVGQFLGGGGKLDSDKLEFDKMEFDKLDFDKLDFDKLGFDKVGQGLQGDFDKLGLRFHKQGQVLEERCKKHCLHEALVAGEILEMDIHLAHMEREERCKKHCLHEAEVAGEILEMDIHLAHMELEDPKDC